MLADLIFIVLVASFFTHELDAIYRHEWRIFPGTHLMPERVGYAVFTLTHIPLFALILWLGFFGTSESQSLFRTLFAIFSIVHIGLHVLYRNHPLNEFNNPLSQLIIWGTGAVGALYLILSL